MSALGFFRPGNTDGIPTKWKILAVRETPIVTRQTLGDQTRDVILERILSGVYKQGDRLVESQIAKELQISQSPVREALRDLTAMRFVELEPFKGARVRRISLGEIAQIYPVRAALEELAGQLAAPHLKGNVEALEEIYRQMHQAAELENVQEFARLDARFHRTIVRASNNPFLAGAWESLLIESWTYFTALRIIVADIGLMPVVKMHRPLLEALGAGDAEGASMKMKSHISDFAGMLEKNFINDAAFDGH